MKTGLKVLDAMTRNPVNVLPGDSVVSVARRMKDERVGNVIVMDKGEIAGIVTERDLVDKVLALEKDPKRLKAEDIMTSDVITIAPDKDIYEALVKMGEHSVRRLPVVDASGVIGILTLKDILKIEPQLFDLVYDKIEVRGGEFQDDEEADKLGLYY